MRGAASWEGLLGTLMAPPSPAVLREHSRGMGGVPQVRACPLPARVGYLVVPGDPSPALSPTAPQGLAGWSAPGVCPTPSCPQQGRGAGGRGIIQVRPLVSAGAAQGSEASGEEPAQTPQGFSGNNVPPLPGGTSSQGSCVLRAVAFESQVPPMTDREAWAFQRVSKGLLPEPHPVLPKHQQRGLGLESQQG